MNIKTSSIKTNLTSCVFWVFIFLATTIGLYQFISIGKGYVGASSSYSQLAQQESGDKANQNTEMVEINEIDSIVSQKDLPRAGDSTHSDLEDSKLDSSIITNDKKDLSQTKNSAPFVPTHIYIEKVNIDLPVISMPLVNGTWDVTPKVANYAEGTSLVNKENGNVGLYGHDRNDAFHRIKYLRPGDKIIIKNGTRQAEYSVYKSYHSNPDNVSVFYPTADPIITLLTCSGEFSRTRYIVQAKLINIK